MPRRIITTILTLLPGVVCLADYSSRGRPWDVPGYHHDSFLTDAFMVIAAIILIAVAGIWLFHKIAEHKEAVTQIGCFVVVIGLVAVIIKCGEKNNKHSGGGTNGVSVPQPMPAQPSSHDQMRDFQTQPVHTPVQKERTVERLETCTYCNGTGRTVCTRCNGSGWIRTTCPSCHGRGNYGQKRCFYCNGKGYTEDKLLNTGRQPCFSCGGTGYTTSDCTTCSGSGTKEEMCDIEAAMYHKTHYVACRHCNGTGQVMTTQVETYYE